MNEMSYIEKNFTWVVEPPFVGEGKIAGSSMPGNGQKSQLEQDLEFLRTKGINGIISLNEAGLDSSTLKKFGLDHLYLPVDDHCPPSIAQMEKMTVFADNHVTLVHCNAGQGRTGF